MSQRTEHYRGYNIAGNAQDEAGVSKFNAPDLPILRNAIFRVIHPAWTEAIGEARLRIDAILR